MDGIEPLAAASTHPNTDIDHSNWDEIDTMMHPQITLIKILLRLREREKERKKMENSISKQEKKPRVRQRFLWNWHILAFAPNGGERQDVAIASDRSHDQRNHKPNAGVHVCRHLFVLFACASNKMCHSFDRSLVSNAHTVPSIRAQTLDARSILLL